MILDEDLKPISPKLPIDCPSAEHIHSGIPIPKASRVYLFSPSEWESFTQEWVSSLKGYFKVRRYSGSGDQGVDVAGFTSDKGLEGGWDNYQCKHYEKPLAPTDIWVEIGKIIYYSYKKEYPVPRKYYFVASRDMGTKLGKLLEKPEELKKETQNNWEKYCQEKITETISVKLEGELLIWLKNFDFSIFSSKSVLDLIDGHEKTHYHVGRFGGGLKPRPTVTIPPSDQKEIESLYIKQLFSAYSDYLQVPVNDVSDLPSQLSKDFLRQRERFYHAESLRNFARDTVTDGTFERLQDEIFHGVIDVCENSYKDGLDRMRATVSQAANISTASNPLRSVVQVQDKQGICHQLANEDQLFWVPKGEEN